MSKFVLREYFALCEGGVCQDLLTEGDRKFIQEGGMILSGKLQEGDLENGNKRIYPFQILKREIENYKKVVIEKRAMGELDHPESSVVNLKNVSHMVIDVWTEGKTVMGKLKVLNTPSGRILRSLVESDAQLGISSRGLGSVKEKSGKTYVEDDFQLICFDIVSDPSTPGAYMKLQENKTPESQIFDKSDQVYRLLNDILGNEHEDG